MQEGVHGVHDADVIVVGSGPTGQLLALMLAQKGHKIIVVERWPAAYPRPRAVTFDDEVARILSNLGIDPENDERIEYFDDWYELRNAEGETLQSFDWRGVTTQGWRRMYWFHQPDLERRFADMLKQHPGVEVRRGWEAVGLSQDDEGITLTGQVDAQSADGVSGLGAYGELRVDPANASPARTETLRARYVVGADGANSFVRQAAGLRSTDLGFSFDWLIVDILPKDGTDRFKPPIWQCCDPARPTTLVPGGPGRRRWEFMALPGEDIEQLNTAETAWKLLERWGATPANATLERHTVWRFNARWSDPWRHRRALIAGDAAHLMPPFAGQGMCAGLRDAYNLGWRLDLVLRGISGGDLLDGYGTERSGHVQHFIQLSLAIGKAVCITDPLAAKARDDAMRAARADPSLAPPPPPPLVLGPGAWIEGSPQAGHLAWQGLVRHKDQTGRFDEIVGRGWQLLGYGLNPATALKPEQREPFVRAGGQCFEIVDAGKSGIEDVEGFYARWFKELGADWILVRPDHYVAASGRKDNLDALLAQLLASLSLLPVGA